MKFIVRPLRSDELPELYKLIASLFSSAKIDIGESDTVFVAEINGTIVGFASFSKKSRGFLLNGLGVKEEFRNQGVGKQLLIKSLGSLPRDVPISLKVQATNDPAIALYVKNGFFQKKYGDIFVMVKLPEN